MWIRIEVIRNEKFTYFYKMEIKGSIKKIQYDIKLAGTLEVIEWSDFEINDIPTACLISDGQTTFAISKWVSPKRTRSYPYERVYNTLNISKKITVIPIVKDEGAAGDRDFIQWDTVSLMSLLDVYVIFAYYEKAESKGNKITNQKFDNDYVLSKIDSISKFHSSALHWNLNELDVHFDDLLEKVKLNYAIIQQQMAIKLHNINGINRLQKKIDRDVEKFKTFSRGKALEAQKREFRTLQPKEVLSTATKAKITITNYLGGQYYFTVDEIEIQDEIVYLKEGKHTKSNLLPSKSDIKDGLLKMILYSNIENVEIENNTYLIQAVLELTSSLLRGQVDSYKTNIEKNAFFELNKFSETQIQFIETLFEEAVINNFKVVLKQI